MNLQERLKMRLNEIREPDPFKEPLQHVDEVKSYVQKSGNQWLVWAQLGNFLPEINVKFLKAQDALNAVQDLQTLGILVRGSDVLEAAVTGEAAEEEGQEI